MEQLRETVGESPKTEKPSRRQRRLPEIVKGRVSVGLKEAVLRIARDNDRTEADIVRQALRAYPPVEELYRQALEAEAAEALAS